MLVLMYSAESKSTPLDLWFLTFGAGKPDSQSLDFLYQKQLKPLYIQPLYIQPLHIQPLPVMPVISFAPDAEEAKSLMSDLPDYLNNLRSLLQAVYWDTDNKTLIKILKFLLDVENIEIVRSLDDAFCVMKAISFAGRGRKIKEQDAEVQFLLWLIDSIYTSAVTGSEDPATVLWFMHQHPPFEEYLYNLAHSNIGALDALSRAPELLDSIQLLASAGLPGINDMGEALSIAGQVLLSTPDVTTQNIYFLIVGYLYEQGLFNKTVIYQYADLHNALSIALSSLDIPETCNLKSIAGGILDLAINNPAALSHIMHHRDDVGRLLHLFQEQPVLIDDVGQLLHLFQEQPALINATDEAIRNGADLSSLILFASNLQAYAEQLNPYLQTSLDFQGISFTAQAPVTRATPGVSSDAAFLSWKSSSAEHVLQRHPERDRLLGIAYKYAQLRTGLLDIGAVQPQWLIQLLNHPQVLAWLRSFFQSTAYVGTTNYPTESVIEAVARILNQLYGVVTEPINHTLMYLQLLHAVQQQASVAFQLSHTCPLPVAAGLQSQLASSFAQVLGIQQSEAEELMVVFMTHLHHSPQELHVLFSAGSSVQVTASSEQLVAGLQYMSQSIVNSSESHTLEACVQNMLVAPSLVAYLLQQIGNEGDALRLLQFLTALTLNQSSSLDSIQTHILAFAGRAAMAVERMSQPEESHHFLLQPLTELVGMFLSGDGLHSLAISIRDHFDLSAEDEVTVETIKSLFSKKKK